MSVGDQPVSGIHQAVFGDVTEDDVTAWLDRHLRRRLAAGVQEVLVRTGRLAAVYGLRLTDGTEAATWVMAYNARCQLHNQLLGHPPGAGSFLQLLSQHRDGYLRLRW